MVFLFYTRVFQVYRFYRTGKYYTRLGLVLKSNIRIGYWWQEIGGNRRGPIDDTL